MPSEKEKMLAGDLYNAADPQLQQERRKARLLIKQLNDSRDDETALRRQVLGELLPGHGKNVCIEPPFFCDYGYNIHLGDNVFFNFNCTLLDVMTISIGNYTLIGPNVQIYTAMHPMNWQQRAAGDEFGKPVVIGSHVWIGGGAVICPGVTIGQRCVIGAGSVVTSNIPDDSFAAGNPCRVIKQLEK